MVIKSKEEFLKYYNAARITDTHKGDYGRVFIIAGAEGMTGAAMLCAEGAIRAGAGLVYLFAPAKLLPIYELGCREAVKIKIGDENTCFFDEAHIKQIMKVIRNASNTDCVVLGPGLGLKRETQKFVRGILNELKETKVTVILDADGLNAINKGYYKQIVFLEKLIITPHEGEMSRLTGLPISKNEKDRIKAAGLMSKELGAITVLKGNKSVVFQDKGFEEAIYINETGNPGMATGGSGDVLSGIIAGIAASDRGENTLFDVTCVGVFIHGLCGDISSDKYGQRAVKAGDLIEMLKEVGKL